MAYAGMVSNRGSRHKLPFWQILIRGRTFAMRQNFLSSYYMGGTRKGEKQSGSILFHANQV
jgi:hypothetical protein